MPPYDLVTVVYEEEVELLALQAKSLNLFGRQLSIDHIYLVVNGGKQDHTISRIISEVLPLYGDWKAKVRIIQARDLTPYSESASGWHSQQVIKLVVAKLLESTYYVTFDAKNHLVRVADDNIFFSPEGLPLFYPSSSRGHMAPYFMGSARICGIDGEKHIDWGFPTITPSVLYREQVLNLCNFIAGSKYRSIGHLICESDVKVTEYMLYFCFLLKNNNFAALYRPGPYLVVTLWASHVENNEQFEVLMNDAEMNSAPFFSVHRLARAALTEQQRRRIISFWQRLGLAAGPKEAAYFLGQTQTPTARENADARGAGQGHGRGPTAHPIDRQLPLSRPLTSLILSLLNTQKRGAVKFLQIGGNDGALADPIHFWARQNNWSGIIVEPVPAYFRKLAEYYKDCPFIRCVQVAIDIRSGEREIFTVRKQAVQRQLEDTGQAFLQGIASFFKDHLLMHGVDSKDIESIIVKTEPVSNLIKMYNLSKIDALVIDVEGAEELVFRSLAAKFPLVDAIIFEGMYLSGECSIFIEQLLSEHDFVLYKMLPDYVAVRRGSSLDDVIVFMDAAHSEWFGNEAAQ